MDILWSTGGTELPCLGFVRHLRAKWSTAATYFKRSIPPGSEMGIPSRSFEFRGSNYRCFWCSFRGALYFISPPNKIAALCRRRFHGFRKYYIHISSFLGENRCSIALPSPLQFGGLGIISEISTLGMRCATCTPSVLIVGKHNRLLVPWEKR